MATEKIIIGIFFLVLGVFFFLNNKNVAKGAFQFYRWLYTRKNLVIIFRILGILLVVGGLVLILVD